MLVEASCANGHTWAANDIPATGPTYSSGGQPAELDPPECPECGEAAVSTDEHEPDWESIAEARAEARADDRDRDDHIPVLD